MLPILVRVPVASPLLYAVRKVMSISEGYVLVLHADCAAG